MNKQWAESCWPWALAILTSIATAVWYKEVQVKESSIDSILSAGISVAGISVGFAGTILAIMFSLKKTRTIQFLQQGDKFNRLVGFGLVPVHANIVFALTCAFGLLLKHSSDSELNRYWCAITVFTGTLSLCSSYRFIRIIAITLKNND